MTLTEDAADPAGVLWTVTVGVPSLTTVTPVFGLLAALLSRATPAGERIE